MTVMHDDCSLHESKFLDDYSTIYVLEGPGDCNVQYSLVSMMSSMAPDDCDVTDVLLYNLYL
jgi:hypothetical protein